jgi:hypothetical protein
MSSSTDTSSSTLSNQDTTQDRIAQADRN